MCETKAELLKQAWAAYRQNPEFRKDFELAQKAFSGGNLNAIASRLRERGASRARQRAAKAKAAK